VIFWGNDLGAGPIKFVHSALVYFVREQAQTRRNYLSPHAGRLSVFKWLQRIQGQQNKPRLNGLKYSIHLKQNAIQKGDRHYFIASHFI